MVKDKAQQKQQKFPVQTSAGSPRTIAQQHWFGQPCWQSHKSEAKSQASETGVLMGLHQLYVALQTTVSSLTSARCQMQCGMQLLSRRGCFTLQCHDSVILSKLRIVGKVTGNTLRTALVAVRGDRPLATTFGGRCRLADGQVFVAERAIALSAWVCLSC